MATLARPPVSEAFELRANAETVRRVPFHRPSLGEEEEAEILDTLRSGWLTTGPKTKLFEARFAEYTHSRHAIAVNSCTAALHLSLIGCGVQSGDEVITTPMTFAATVNVIEHVGARPVFVDVEPDTLNIDPNRIEDAITPRTRAVVPVHFAGHPCELVHIRAIADVHGLRVIEDAAHAVESSYRGRKVGSISPLTCFSFYATKNMTTGEGGMVTTDCDELAERVRVLSLHGISVDAWKRYGPGQYRHWEILEPGYKYNMFDLQACLGLHQLAKVDGFCAMRRRLTERYDEAFAQVPEITVMERREHVQTAYHLYVVRFDTRKLGASRDELMTSLQERGIGIGIHFRAVHLHPYYANKYGYERGMCPIAESAGDEVISLPLFPGMNDEESDYVIDQVVALVHSLRG